MRALARRRPTARPDAAHDGHRTRPVHRTATRNGRQLDLLVKKFALLKALLLASPAYLSTERLLDQVWDEHANPFTNTAAVTIGRLRRKLSDPLITTTSAWGTRFAPARERGELKRFGRRANDFVVHDSGGLGAVLIGVQLQGVAVTVPARGRPSSHDSQGRHATTSEAP
ncbi:winged helix-turn-helix domain-containing protein [Allokutzneria sp. A3M-2-11 16]|uniref:winged helix-turn-helix domain-containing protein n=1 Tax=Allokutzneria sp. A3M-2-11 16 TaxID=2962043 RepID=UPI0020B7C2A2|nr:winged helix-turn-helix domain-containing protein [Allokutzneria sp. A3M-2-11 16]MCP3798456.1 winged helix-turn-helix domain-containing protein [Allokutzneria sp. A3M-2-11 16]